MSDNDVDVKIIRKILSEWLKEDVGTKLQQAVKHGSVEDIQNTFHNEAGIEITEKQGQSLKSFKTGALTKLAISIDDKVTWN